MALITGSACRRIRHVSPAGPTAIAVRRKGRRAAQNQEEPALRRCSL